jgi:hypothetical protein
LTHNAEACVAALLGLRGIWVPNVYCVHTLLGWELSASLKILKIRINLVSEGVRVDSSDCSTAAVIVSTVSLPDASMVGLP